MLDVPDPPPLPDGSIVERLLFESPMAVIAIVIALTCVLFFRARGHSDSGRSGLIVLVGSALAVLIGAVAAIVETNAERLREITITLVADAISGNAERVGATLHDECTLIEPFSRDEMDRDRILKGIRDRIPTFGITDHAALDARAYAPNDRFGRVQVKVRVNISGAGVHFSWWELEYERQADGAWCVIRIKPLSMSGRDAL